jgi:hypothetical protein
MTFRLFEFEDKSWLPSFIREGMTDYLRFILNGGNFYEPVSPLIIQVLQQTSAAQVIDLCSGGGGTIEQIQKNLQEKYQQQVLFLLTDKFPNINAYKFIENKTGGKVSYNSLPVDATKVDSSLAGVRTIFSAFHHFDKDTSKLVLENAVEAKQGIAVFDGGDKNLLIVTAIIILHPIIFILCTPFFRPFKWSRLLFTYLIPLIPLCTVWDGVVSIARLYSPLQLLNIAKSIDGGGYCWKAGKVKNRYGMNVTYLLGYPVPAPID